MSTPACPPGICRIDRRFNYHHGYFVRLQRRGKIHAASFADKMYGGRAQALEAAQQYYRKLLAKLGPPEPMSRRRRAEIRRGKGSSNIVGVQQRVVWRQGQNRMYWVAIWSPEPYVVARKVFSVRKYGFRKAKLLAIRARRAGVRSMQ